MNTIDRIFDKSHQPELFARNYLLYLAEILEKMDYDSIGEMIKAFLRARETGATIFFVGNGGSASTASHFANDISIGSNSKSKPFRAISLCDNMSIITAIGNDYGYDQIFVRQLDKLMASGDILVAISASGNSPNVIKAVEYANENGAVSIGLSGFDGGRLRKACQISVHVPSRKGEYGPVEDLHMMLDHLAGSYLKCMCKTEPR